jgi:hypothetical protein
MDGVLNTPRNIFMLNIVLDISLEPEVTNPCVVRMGKDCPKMADEKDVIAETLVWFYLWFL